MDYAILLTPGESFAMPHAITDALRGGDEILTFDLEAIVRRALDVRLKNTWNEVTHGIRVGLAFQLCMNDMIKRGEVWADYNYPPEDKIPLRAYPCCYYSKANPGPR